jgi:deoxycytidylate deaminase
VNLTSGAKNEKKSFYQKDLDIKMTSTHAEVNFLLTYGVVETLYVVSPYKMRFKYSRPCENCILMMRHYGVKDVVYSTGCKDIPFKTESVANMPLLGKSRGDRN